MNCTHLGQFLTNAPQLGHKKRSCNIFNLINQLFHFWSFVSFFSSSSWENRKHLPPRPRGWKCRPNLSCWSVDMSLRMRYILKKEAPAPLRSLTQHWLRPTRSVSFWVLRCPCERLLWRGGGPELRVALMEESSDCQRQGTVPAIQEVLVLWCTRANCLRVLLFQLPNTMTV